MDSVTSIQTQDGIQWDVPVATHLFTLRLIRNLSCTHDVGAGPSLLSMKLMSSFDALFALHRRQRPSRVRLESTAYDGIIIDLMLGDLSRRREDAEYGNEAKAKPDD